MADRFTSLEALKEHFKPKDYRIRCLRRNSPVTVISAHGGFIEAGTSAIAHGVAGRNYNLFDFQCLSAESAKDMHVTSTRFRDPQLEKLLFSSSVAVSIHGMGNQGEATIWLGGMNQELKEITLNVLRGQGFHVNPDGPLYRGENPENIVNLPPKRGVQLEISNELMDTLFCGHAFRSDRRSLATNKRFKALVRSMRLALRLYLLHHGNAE